MCTCPSDIPSSNLDVIFTELSGQNDPPGPSLSRVGARSCCRWKSLLVIGCLVCLQGCSGCQKIPPEARAEPQNKTSPLDAVPHEVAPPATVPELQPPAELNTTPPAKQPSDTLPDQNKSAPKPSQSSPASGNRSQSSGGTLSRGSSGTGTSTNKTTSTQSGRQPQTAAEALELAQGLRRSSAKAANRGDIGKAFELASQGWDALRPFPNDAGCKAIAGQLKIELESLAARANASVGSGDAKTKRLVEQ